MGVILGPYMRWTSVDAILAASTNDWLPTGLVNAVVLRASATVGNPSLTGLAGGEAGRVIALVCVAGSFTISHEDGASAAANRFILDSGSFVTVTSLEGGFLFVYDATSSRWRQIGGDN